MANWKYRLGQLWNLDLFHRLEIVEHRDLKKWFLEGYTGSPEDRQVIATYDTENEAHEALLKITD